MLMQPVIQFHYLSVSLIKFQLCLLLFLLEIFLGSLVHFFVHTGVAELGRELRYFDFELLHVVSGCVKICLALLVVSLALPKLLFKGADPFIGSG